MGGADWPNFLHVFGFWEEARSTWRERKLTLGEHAQKGPAQARSRTQDPLAVGHFKGIRSPIDKKLHSHAEYLQMQNTNMINSIYT